MDTDGSACARGVQTTQDTCLLAGTWDWLEVRGALVTSVPLAILQEQKKGLTFRGVIKIVSKFKKKKTLMVIAQHGGAVMERWTVTRGAAPRATGGNHGRNLVSAGSAPRGKMR